MVQESIILPSQGYPYFGRVEGSSVIVKPLTTRVYKDFLVSPSEEAVLNLVDNCLVDCPIKAEEMVYQDELAIYLKIRTLSMGSLLPVFSTCPKCKNKNTDNWDLMQLECNYLVLDEYPMSITLPESGKKVSLLYPTSKSNRLAREQAQKRAGLFNKNLSEFLSSFQMAEVIIIDGLNDIVDKAEWYNSLPLVDAIYIDQVLEKMQDFGIVTNRVTQCQTCKHEYITPLQITSDFFRPIIGNINGIKTAKGTLEKGITDANENEHEGTHISN